MRKYKINIFYILLFIVIVLIILSYFFKNMEGFNTRNYHIVCAKYNKDVDFLKNIDIASTVIEKGKDVPNKAHEATSYLYYIIKNYDNLPNNIIFIHDENRSWHHEGKITDNIYYWIENYELENKKYYEFNHTQINKDFDVYDNNIAYQDFWKKFIEPIVGNYEEAIPEIGQCCAQFIVSKAKIMEKPKSYYEAMNQWLLDNTEGEGNGDKDSIYSGYNTSRYAEWSWRFIFT